MNLTKLDLTVSTIVFLMLAVSAAAGQEQPSIDTRELPPNHVIESKMTGAEIHRYKVNLKAGEFFQVRVEQKGIDVVLKLLDAEGLVLGRMLSPSRREGPETISYVAAQSSRLVLEVSAFYPTAELGDYTIKREASHPATAKDKRRVEVEAFFVAGMTAKELPGEEETALKNFLEAQKGWRELADNYMVELTAREIVFKEIDLLIKEGTSESLRAALSKTQATNQLYKRKGDRTGEADALVRAGIIDRELGRTVEALQSYKWALSLFRVLTDKRAEASTLSGIGQVYSDLSENQEALSYLNQAGLLYKAIDYKWGKAATLGGIGVVYADLGQHRKALFYYDQALPLYKAVGDKRGEAAILYDMGLVYYKLGDKQKTFDYYNRALSVNRAVGDRRREAYILSAIGLAHHRSREYQKALDYFAQALFLNRAVSDRRAEAVTLTIIGGVYYALHENQKALDYYTKALSLRRVVRDKRGESVTLAHMMLVWQSLNNQPMAVFYGKQSVNKLQELRQAIQGLDKETQQIYLGSVANVYQGLAELLIAAGRLLEAEQVLAMLKQEEVFDYLRRDASETSKLLQRADLTKAEAAALKRYNEIAERITALGEEFSSLDELRRKGNKLDEGQEKRLKELSQLIQDANHVFEVFLREVAEEFAKRPQLGKELAESTGLQFDFQSWGKGVVFLYTLVGEDRYRVVLITRKVKTDGKSDIKAATLDEKIEAFRQAVQNPSSDPRPLGKELYDILIKPIEKQLEGANADTLLWSLDGNLRLLPLAALWDGKQYFGQKYKNVIVTRASLTRLGKEGDANWRALALGTSKPKNVRDPNGVGNHDFGALPAVKDELRSIVQSPQSPNGVMPGQSLIDDEFNEPALENELLRGYRVVHIASHFSLNPGNATKSFLLLGDGSTLTVEQIRTNTQLEFEGVELLTLSACQTALVGKDTSGQEIEGFGYVAQTRGAKAILASLWRVADDSTQILMSRFYRLRKENPQLTKADVLQLAQIEMIEGKLSPPATRRPQLVTGGAGSAETNATPYSHDPKSLYSHPYFWAPFILIGNWR